MVRLSGGNVIGLAADDRSYDELIDAENAESQDLLDRLTGQGRVVWVPNGTGVLVIRRSMFSQFVKVMDGVHAGFEGWVQREFVVREPPAPPPDPTLTLGLASDTGTVAQEQTQTRLGRQIEAELAAKDEAEVPALMQAETDRCVQQERERLHRAEQRQRRAATLLKVGRGPGKVREGRGAASASTAGSQKTSRARPRPGRRPGAGRVCGW